MLRHYQDNGILEPDSVDPYTGHRYYRAEQLVTAHWVVAMRDAGLPVADIAQALIHRDNPERLRELLTHQRRRIAAERERVVNLENAFDRTVAPLACRQVPAVDVVMATLKGGYEGLPEVTAAIGAYIAANGLETGTMSNIYRVSPAQNPDPATWVTEVCFPIHS